jgi:hypothetical protein
VGPPPVAASQVLEAWLTVHGRDNAGPKGGPRGGPRGAPEGGQVPLINGALLYVPAFRKVLGTATVQISWVDPPPPPPKGGVPGAQGGGVEKKIPFHRRPLPTILQLDAPAAALALPLGGRKDSQVAVAPLTVRWDAERPFAHLVSGRQKAFLFKNVRGDVADERSHALGVGFSLSYESISKH